MLRLILASPLVMHSAIELAIFTVTCVLLLALHVAGLAIVAVYGTIAIAGVVAVCVLFLTLCAGFSAPRLAMLEHWCVRVVAAVGGVMRSAAAMLAIWLGLHGGVHFLLPRRRVVTGKLSVPLVFCQAVLRLLI